MSSAKSIYIVYQTTNLVNRKFYIGVHKENGRNYIGSGKLLTLAIKKYGRKNFIRETLQEFSNEQDAYDYEKVLVNEDMVKNPLCYNICVGGHGGCPPTHYGEDNWMHTTGFGNNHPMKGKHHSEESKRKMSEQRKGVNHHNYGKHLPQRTKQKISNANKGKIRSDKVKKKMSDDRKGEKHPWFNKHHSEKSKERISNSNRKYIYYLKNKIFYSSKEAGVFFNVTYNAILKWCKNEIKTDCYRILK